MARTLKRIARWFLVLLVCTTSYVFWPCALSTTQLNKLLAETSKEQFISRKKAILIDYSKPVFKKRLWLIDLRTKKMLLNCHVSHARKSGRFWPRKYSNKAGSELSCTGRFKALHTYESNYGKGEHKIGLKLQD